MSGAPWVWPPVNVSSGGGTVTTDDVQNASEVPGTTLTDVLNAQYAPSVNAWLLNPLAPNSFDLFAALMTDPDLANNGWLVNDITTGTTLTRAGAFDMFSPRPTGFTYQSSLSNGLLFIRTPAGMTVGVSKLAQPGLTGYTLRTHVWTNKQTANGTFTANAYAFGWSAGTSGLINGPVTLNTASQSQTTWAGAEDSRWIIAEQTQGNFPIVDQQIDQPQNMMDLVIYMHFGPGPGQQDVKVIAGSQIGFFQPAPVFATTKTRLIDRAGWFMNSGPDGMTIVDSVRMLPYLTFP